MNTKQTIDQLWREFREAINSAYTKADKERDEDSLCLHDYAENISWNDALARLLGRETANERQHRSNRPSVPGFSQETAAKLILMGNVASAAKSKDMPRATIFLIFRQTAAEAQVIGFLIRHELSTEWFETLNKLDYAKLMQGKG